MRCPVVPAATGQRIQVTVRREGRFPITAQQGTDLIDCLRRKVAKPRLSSYRDYEELFQEMKSSHALIAIVGRRDTADGKPEYEVQLGDSATTPQSNYVRHSSQDTSSEPSRRSSGSSTEDLSAVSGQPS
jgi:hypothetical protein